MSGSLPRHVRSEDAHITGATISDADITLSELVAEIMDVSTAPSGKYFDPPPEARFMSNRNVAARNEGPITSVAFSEQSAGPFDVELDSTTEVPNLSAPPFSFVSDYLGPYMCLMSASLIPSNNSAMFIPW